MNNNNNFDLKKYILFSTISKISSKIFLDIFGQITYRISYI